VLLDGAVFSEAATSPGYRSSPPPGSPVEAGPESPTHQGFRTGALAPDPDRARAAALLSGLEEEAARILAVPSEPLAAPSEVAVSAGGGVEKPPVGRSAEAWAEGPLAISQPLPIPEGERTLPRAHFPKPVVAVADEGLDADLRAALGRSDRPRWPLYAGGLVALGFATALILGLGRQPETDKKDSPWLEGSSGQKADSASRPPGEGPKVAPPSAAPTTPPTLPSTLPPTPPPAIPVASPAGKPATGSAPPAATGQATTPPTPALSPDLSLSPAPKPAPPLPAGASAQKTAEEYARALSAGELLIKKGKFKAAVAELQRAVRLGPDSVPALLELGDALLESDQPRGALKPLERAVKLDAKSGRANLLLGTAYQSIGKNPEAIRAYKRYLELDPSGQYAHDVRSILSNLQR
jgi:hypothetical protein